MFTTLHTITEAISTGLPFLSLTFSLGPLNVRARRLIFDSCFSSTVLVSLSSLSVLTWVVLLSVRL